MMLVKGAEWGGGLVVQLTHDAEEDGQEREAHQLDRLAADGIDERDGHPVARNGAGADEDQVADGDVAVVLVPKTNEKC